MLLITRQILANEAAKRWGKQYPPDRWPDKQYVLRQLTELGGNCDADEVDKIIGNGSWTTTECHECGNDEGVDVVQVGQQLDYESSTANVCKSCLRKALNL